MSIDPMNPLAVAAREVNDYAAEHGMEKVLEWLKLGDGDEVAHLANQRALRAVAVHDFGRGDLDEPLARQIALSQRFEDLRLLLMISYLDGLTTGWRARALTEIPYLPLEQK